MERFVLRKSTIRGGWWVLTDTDNMIVVNFKEHDFNNSQEVKMQDPSAFSSPTEIARAMREIGDYMAENHYDLCF